VTFFADSKLAEMPLAVGETTLAYACEGQCWGIGFMEGTPMAQDLTRWTGGNLLGPALTQVCADLKRKNLL
jgi:predicted NAD-dependent protein-ADP-ribosyltransferase YbiA (DUF1768 family)